MPRMSHQFRITLAGLAFGLGVSSQALAASYTTLDLPSFNANINSYTGGSGYASEFTAGEGTTLRTYGGVTFLMERDPAGNNAYADPFWNGNLVMDVDVFGVTSAYTLINSAYGLNGAFNGTITFLGSAGASHSVSLVQGVNIRDHFAGGFNNVIDGVNAVNAFSSVTGARLDMQVYILPVAFASQRLLSITFSGDSSSQNLYGGVPFIVAATVATGTVVSAVPEPGSALMLLAGAAVLGGALRARRRS